VSQALDGNGVAGVRGGLKIERQVVSSNLGLTNFVPFTLNSVNPQFFAFLTKFFQSLSSASMSAKPSSRQPIRSSTAVEDYLERILELINTKGYARVVDIAQGLKISQASVTNMVQRLDAEGLLKYEKYRGLALTTAGEELALNITRRHQLLTDFLKLLGLDDEVIYHDVEGMEHHISPPTLRAIQALTEQLQRQPALLAKVRKQTDEN
jgi:Mn-dependent DtxR family transcriptional regulator